MPIKQIWHTVARSIAVMLTIVFVSACASSTADRYQVIEQDAATSGVSLPNDKLSKNNI